MIKEGKNQKVTFWVGSSTSSCDLSSSSVMLGLCVIGQPKHEGENLKAILDAFSSRKIQRRFILIGDKFTSVTLLFNSKEFLEDWRELPFDRLQSLCIDKVNALSNDAIALGGILAQRCKDFNVKANIVTCTQVVERYKDSYEKLLNKMEDLYNSNETPKEYKEAFDVSVEAYIRRFTERLHQASGVLTQAQEKLMRYCALKYFVMPERACILALAKEYKIDLFGTTENEDKALSLSRVYILKDNNILKDWVKVNLNIRGHKVNKDKKAIHKGEISVDYDEKRSQSSSSPEHSPHIKKIIGNNALLDLTLPAAVASAGSPADSSPINNRVRSVEGSPNQSPRSCSQEGQVSLDDAKTESPYFTDVRQSPSPRDSASSVSRPKSPGSDSEVHTKKQRKHAEHRHSLFHSKPRSAPSSPIKGANFPSLLKFRL